MSKFGGVFTYRMGGSNVDGGFGPGILKRVCNERGWRDYKHVQEDESWNLWWKSGGLNLQDYKNIKKWQFVSHIPRGFIICRKDCLARSLERLKKVYGKIYDITPKTYYLPTDYTKLVADNMQKSMSYICKPTNSCRGRGIFLFNDLNDVCYEHNTLVQQYIHNPFLVGGYKFDLRLYVCIPSFYPLTIYLYKDGLVRFATEQFCMDDIKNIYSHLTNSSVNKKAPLYAVPKDIIGSGCKWDFKRLRQYFKTVGVRDWLMWQKIWHLIILSILSHKARMPKTKNCFELYGFDVLIDSNLKPWLLEVNFTPALSNHCETDSNVKKPMLHDMFDLLGFPDRKMTFYNAIYKTWNKRNVPKDYQTKVVEYNSANKGRKYLRQVKQELLQMKKRKRRHRQRSTSNATINNRKSSPSVRSRSPSVKSTGSTLFSNKGNQKPTRTSRTPHTTTKNQDVRKKSVVSARGDEKIRHKEVVNKDGREDIKQVEVKPSLMKRPPTRSKQSSKLCVTESDVSIEIKSTVYNTTLGRVQIPRIRENKESRTSQVEENKESRPSPGQQNEKQEPEVTENKTEEQIERSATPKNTKISESKSCVKPKISNTSKNLIVKKTQTKEASRTKMSGENSQVNNTSEIQHDKNCSEYKKPVNSNISAGNKNQDSRTSATNKNQDSRTSATNKNQNSRTSATNKNQNSRTSATNKNQNSRTSATNKNQDARSKSRNRERSCSNSNNSDVETRGLRKSIQNRSANKKKSTTSTKVRRKKGKTPSWGNGMDWTQPKCSAGKWLRIYPFNETPSTIIDTKISKTSTRTEIQESDSRLKKSILDMIRFERKSRVLFERNPRWSDDKLCQVLWTRMDMNTDVWLPSKY